MVEIWKIRQAGTLVLVGWFLMVPPPAGAGRRLTFEPLWMWKVIDTFDSREECEQMRSDLIQRMSGTAIETTQYVSGYDLRLKGRPEQQPIASDNKAVKS